MNKDRLIALTLLILAAAASRIAPHAPNFTPVAAIALFAGARFERTWLAFAIPFAALLLSDAVIGFYAPMEMLATYTGFAVVVCIGTLIRGSERVLSIATATLAGAVAFFLVTNCNFLLSSSLYPQNFDGLVQGYVAGLPFFRNTLISDILYTALLFGGFALAERKFTRLKSSYAAA